MVTVDMSFEELRREVDSNLSIETLEAVLLNLGLEIDEVNGDDLKIEIGADRADLISLQGLIRLLKAYSGKPYLGFDVVASNRKVVIDSSVKDVWPHTVSAVVTGLQLSEEKLKEIINFQEKLHATFGRKRKKVSIGIYPLDKITFPIDYLAMPANYVVFTPLGSDKQMNGLEILEQTDVGKTYGHLLEGKENFPIFRDAAGHILSMPPIINSEYAGRVTADSSDLFIECSGHDLIALNYTLQIIVAMLADMGGSVESLTIVDGSQRISPDMTPRLKKISVDYVNSILGTALSEDDFVKLLERMMYKIIDRDITVQIPSFRTDVWHEIDIVDDIVRAYGINNIVSKVSGVATIAASFNETKVKDLVRSSLVSIGFIEAFTLTLTDFKDQYDKMNLPVGEHIKLGSAEEKSVNMCRVSLLPELLKCLRENRQHSLPWKMFEVGDVVLPANTDVLSKSDLRLAGVIADTTVSYTDVKQVVDYLAKMLGLELKIEMCEHASFIEGRVGRILIDDIEVGFIGEIAPVVLTNWNLEVAVVGFEISLQQFVSARTLADKD